MKCPDCEGKGTHSSCDDGPGGLCTISPCETCLGCGNTLPAVVQNGIKGLLDLVNSMRVSAEAAELQAYQAGQYEMRRLASSEAYDAANAQGCDIHLDDVGKWIQDLPIKTTEEDKICAVFDWYIFVEKEKQKQKEG